MAVMIRDREYGAGSSSSDSDSKFDPESEVGSDHRTNEGNWCTVTDNTIIVVVVADGGK